VSRHRTILYLAIGLLALIVRLIYVARLPPGAITEPVDALGYDQLACNLIAGHGLSLCESPPYYPTNIRTPLYPAFVATVYILAGERPIAVAVAQAILDSVTALLVGVIAERLANRRTGLIATAMYALLPGQVQFVGTLMTETLLAFLIALTVWVWTDLVIAPRSDASGLVTEAAPRPAINRRTTKQRPVNGASRIHPTPLCSPRESARLCGAQPSEGGRPADSWWHARTALLCGVLCGLCALVKPNSLALGAIWATATLFAVWRKTSRRALVLAACVLIANVTVLFPWLARNRAIFGRWYLANSFQGGLIRVTAPVTLAWVRGVPAIPWSPPVEAIYNELVTQTAARHGWTPALWCDVPPLEFEQRERQVMETAWAAIRPHLDIVWRVHWLGFLRSWAPENFAHWYRQFGLGEWSDTGVPAGGYANAIEFASSGDWGAAIAEAIVNPWKRLPPAARAIWFGWGAAYALGGLLALLGVWQLRRQPVVLFGLLATILYTVFLPGPISSLRFRMPVVPLIAVLMAAGCGARGRMQVNCPATPE
jgi:4-amino-4-deoxy-L-arabinose transferase-like glycosyltransferase